MQIRKEDEWLREIDGRFNEKKSEIEERIMKEIRERMKLIKDVGIE